MPIKRAQTNIISRIEKIGKRRASLVLVIKTKANSANKVGVTTIIKAEP